MNWTVLWLPDAEQELADAWLNAPFRDAVTRAAHIIDQLLQRDPENNGQPILNGRRCVLVPPLGVLFRILADEQRVEVIHVWLLTQGNGQVP
jgi:hypothetical protein